MTILGYILCGLGFIICAVGNLKFLAIAYRRSFFWQFGCLFIPFVDLIFFFLNLRATWRPVALAYLGLLIAILGCWLGGLCPFSSSS